MTCEGVLFTPPVGCGILPSAVNGLATTFFTRKNCELHQCSVHCHHEVLEKKKTNATFGIDKKGLVQVALLQIRGGDGSQL